jgi:hypothetical protein
MEDDLLSTEKYPPQDLINWIKTEDKKIRKTRWQNSENDMKNRKKEMEWNIDTKKMKRQYQVVISRLRPGLTMAKHGYIMNKSQHPKQHLGHGRRRNETYRIRQKIGFYFLPRDIDNMKEQNEINKNLKKK